VRVYATKPSEARPVALRKLDLGAPGAAALFAGPAWPSLPRCCLPRLRCETGGVANPAPCQPCISWLWDDAALRALLLHQGPTPAWHLSRIAPTGTRAIGCGVPAWRPPLPAPLRPRRPRNAPRLSLARRAGGPPGADAVGVGVAAWAGRDGRLCLGELTPAGGPGTRGGATLVPGRALDLLPGEAVLQARTRGTCHAAGRCQVQIQGQIQLQH